MTCEQLPVEAFPSLLKKLGLKYLSNHIRGVHLDIDFKMTFRS